MLVSGSSRPAPKTVLGFAGEGLGVGGAKVPDLTMKVQEFSR